MNIYIPMPSFDQLRREFVEQIHAAKDALALELEELKAHRIAEDCSDQMDEFLTLVGTALDPHPVAESLVNRAIEYEESGDFLAAELCSGAVERIDEVEWLATGEQTDFVYGTLDLSNTETVSSHWGEPSDSYKNSQPYHNDLYPF